MSKPAVPAPEATVQALRLVAERYGTPTYAYDIGRMRRRVAALRAAIPQSVEMLASLQSRPKVILSIDSLSELQMLSSGDSPRRALLRLRPDFTSSAVVETGPCSRFGIPFEDLPRCRDFLTSPGIVVEGFHIFSGSQILDAMAIVRHLRGAMELSLRAADVLCLAPEILNLGGGFGVPYGPDDQELDLGPIASELLLLLDRVSPARVVIELGRYLVAQSGWYLTTVVAHQTHRGRQAVVVDGGTHQRSDLCRLGLSSSALPPLALDGKGSVLTPTDVLGCLCLPDDVLAESSPLPPLSPGNVLAFPNAGAYGLSASPSLFLSHPAPAEVAFQGTTMGLLRVRQTAQALLEGQGCFRVERSKGETIEPHE